MIKLKIGSRILNKDGQITTMDVVPFLKNSRTFVPLRFIAEAFGKVVEWNNDTQEVTVYGRKKYFETMDECAFDFAMHWNAASIAMFKEIGAIIYKNDDGYYWDNIKVGKDKGVIWNLTEVRKGVAFIHSHGGGEQWTTESMSREDFNVAKDFQRPLYMVDSGGCLWVYDTTEEKPKQKLVREGAPKDARWMNIEVSAEFQKEYFSTGYYCLDEYKDGYKADFYNKVHMKGLSYLTEGAIK